MRILARDPELAGDGEGAAAPRQAARRGRVQAHAAHAAARPHPMGAVVLTSDVGWCSLVNAVVGAGVERVPLEVLSGAPRSGQND
jgi:hypothetical protein